MSDPIIPAVLFGSFAFIVNLIAVIAATYRLGAAVSKFESIGKQQATEIRELKDAVKVVAELMTNQALQTQRMDNMSARLNRTEQLIDDLRRGEGMILPLKLGGGNG